MSKLDRRLVSCKPRQDTGCGFTDSAIPSLSQWRWAG